MLPVAVVEAVQLVILGTVAVQLEAHAGLNALALYHCGLTPEPGRLT
jgi:hypothetical protein